MASLVSGPHNNWNTLRALISGRKKVSDDQREALELLRAWRTILRDMKDRVGGTVVAHLSAAVEQDSASCSDGQPEQF